jgi:hypothetical protein
VADQPQCLDAFEARLERVLSGFGDAAVRPFDAFAIADQSVVAERRRESRRQWTLLSVAALVSLVSLLVLAALASLIGGPQPMPDRLGVEPRPTQTTATGQDVPPQNVDLMGTWVRSDRPGVALVITASSVRVVDDNGSIRIEDSISIGSGVFTLMEGPLATAECSTYPIVQYVFRLNPTHNGFFALPYNGRGSDPCELRADTFTATWALRSRP